MSDLIRREDAIRVASGYCHPANIAKELERLPSAEPEIIRCKDCKKWHTNCLAVAEKHGCDVLSDYTKPDDYCSWAERRSDG